MPDWLLAIAATLGVIAAIGGGCVLGTWISKVWQAHLDARVWK